MSMGTVKVDDVCRLAGDLQLRLPMADRLLRRGPYPHYAENCMASGIEDYAIEAGGTVMVSALGSVLSGSGTLIAKLEPGCCSASEHVHALIPHDPADARYLWRVLTTSPAAARRVTGSSQLRQLGAAALVTTPIPWPQRPERDAFVAALDEVDGERERLNALIPQIYARADEAYAATVACSDEGRVRVGEICRIARGTDVLAVERGADKAVRVEGPNGALGRCDEALADGPIVAVGPSGRRLLAHYVDEPSHPIAEMAYVTQDMCDVDLPTLLLALRHAGLPDRVRVDGHVAGVTGLTMEGLADVELALGTPQARAAFAPKAAAFVRELCEAEHALVELAHTRAERIRAFFAPADYEPAALPTPRGATVYAAPLNAAAPEPELPLVGSDPELGALAPLARAHGFGLAPDDLAWELAPLAVLRACLDAGLWAPIVQAARALADAARTAADAPTTDDAIPAPYGTPDLIGALDAAMGTLAERDDLLSFLPNLSYASSLLTPAQLAQWVLELDALDCAAITPQAVRATFSLAPMARALPPEVGAVFAGALRGAVALLGGTPETVYVPCEADGLVTDLLARELPDVTLRTQFDDFPHMLAAAMVRAVALRDARETRGGLGAAAGSALVADEFADWVTPLVCAALPPNAGPWCTGAPAADDPRWVLGTPPRNKANFAWLQHALAHQAPGGVTVLLCCNALLHSTSGSEPGLRRTLVEQGRVRLVCALPAGIYGDERPAMSVLVLGDAGCADEVLFVDALGAGVAVEGATPRSLPRRQLPAEAADALAEACAGWLARGERPGGLPEGIAARVVSRMDVLDAGGSLAPWTYAPEA